MNAIAHPLALDRASEATSPDPAYDARMLVGRDATARIVLDSKIYTLRITRAGKLILTK